ncbi:MAG: nitroreductase family protein [Candidatus Thorarchaeota archaeon]|nr:nitroreductase family protein [Candidatus Thorarchaeota archaeon]
MNVKEAIRNRRSYRGYLDKDIEEYKIRAILEAGRWAPSASNKQPWHFIVVQSKEMREKLAQAHAYGRFMMHSPMVIVVLGDPDKHPKYHLCDPHNAVQNMLLAAFDEGLGSCWMGVRDTEIEPAFREILDIPGHLRVICCVSFGYSELKPTSSRKTLDEIVSWEKYQGK